MFRWLGLLWFATHIPTTLLVDAQAVLPAHYFPLQAKQMLAWHIQTTGDHLMRDRPAWFMSFIYFEIFAQLPFFFIATYAYATRKNWVRIPAIMYGVHAATTTIPMVADFMIGAGASNPHKHTCMAIYGTYLAVPLLLALHMASSRIPFPAPRKKKVH